MMMRHHVLHRAALGAVAALLVACGETPLAPTIGGPSFDEGEAPVEVLYPSLEVYRGEARADASIMMSLSAASAMPLVRVAVLDSANSVPLQSRSRRVFLGGTGAWTMTDRATGATLMTGNGGSAEVTLASVDETNYRLQVVCGSVAAVDSLKAAAEALGHPTMTALSSTGCTQLLVGKFAKNASFSVRTAYKNLLISQGIAKSDAWWRLITFGQAIYRVHTGTTSYFDNLNPVSVTAGEGSFVTIDTVPTTSSRFRGVAYAIRSGAGTVAGVNELPMEDYLRGVVPRELGPLQYREVEAQKAQAVAARTYALIAVRGAKRGSDGYDLRSTTADQVYGGYNFEQPMSNEAIDATAGIVAWYNGALITALYSSASGGHTANSEEAYANVVPYLRGVPDAERGNAAQHVPTLEVFKAHANPTSLRAVKESDFETDWPSRHRWTYEWSADEIRAALSYWRKADVGTVHAVNVLERGSSGRVTRIEYVTDGGTFTAEKDAIRGSLPYITSSGLFSSLWSTLFFIEPVKERGEWTGGFRVYGGGFGHGVGMSQVGAVGMASKGHSYDQILHHYYQGITLAPAY